MDYITIDIEKGAFRPTEILSELRIVAETLYAPMKMVGFWDKVEGMHLCPQIERHKPCLCDPENPGEKFISYVKILERERQAALAISFSHSGITIYMS
ncbi:MAG: hypothetical protein CL782_00380 [Chloroflexi bacterium]|nr:hypothetical protein [Chloroflexota bacterium]|tara:strand:+ start:3845 stop:4138 length:294 start_codon:yes stop_codon:yes gene_type:complete